MKSQSAPLVFTHRGRAAAARQPALIAELRSAAPDLRRLAAAVGCSYSNLCNQAARSGWSRMYVSAEERRHLLARRAEQPAPVEPYVVDHRRRSAGSCPPAVAEVFAVVAAHYGTTLAEITAPRHNHALAEARFVACALAVRRLGVRPEHCAIWLGRHRWSSRYYLQTFAARHDTERAFRARVAAIAAALPAVPTASAAA